MTRKPLPNRRDVLPGELQRSAPRPVRLNANGVTLAIVLISLVLGGIGGGLAIYNAATGNAEQARLLATQGRTAEAAVVRVEQRRGERVETFIHYRYLVDGQEFTGRTKLRKRDGSQLTTGSSIPVRYVASNPGASYLRGYEPNGVPIWLAPAVFAALLGGAVPIAWVLRREVRLLEDGRAALARILKAEKVRGRGESTWRVHYEWRLLSGALRRGEYDATKTPPAIGTAIPIVYDREQPRRHARYPLRLARIARR